MENATNWKNIAFSGQFSAFLVRNDLRGDIAWSTTSVEDVVFSIYINCKSKIYNNRLESRFSSKHDIFRFDISMHNSVSVYLGKTICKSS